MPRRSAHRAPPRLCIGVLSSLEQKDSGNIGRTLARPLRYGSIASRQCMLLLSALRVREMRPRKPMASIAIGYGGRGGGGGKRTVSVHWAGGLDGLDGCTGSWAVARGWVLRCDSPSHPDSQGDAVLVVPGVSPSIEQQLSREFFFLARSLFRDQTDGGPTLPRVLDLGSRRRRSGTIVTMEAIREGLVPSERRDGIELGCSLGEGAARR